MDDLISRKAAIEALGEEPLRWNNTITEGQEWNDWKYHVNAIKSVPTFPAVPLDKLCEWLERNAAGRWNGLEYTAAGWKDELTRWMEGLDGSESMVQKT